MVVVAHLALDLHSSLNHFKGKAGGDGNNTGHVATDEPDLRRNGFVRLGRVLNGFHFFFFLEHQRVIVHTLAACHF